MSSHIEDLKGHKYINLETYRKSGKAVRTPVWFVINNEEIFVTTKPDTGKVKRLKNNKSVKIAPCGMKGDVKGNWIDGTARFADESESKTAVELRNKKYGMLAKIVRGFAYRNVTPTVIAIKV